MYIILVKYSIDFENVGYLFPVNSGEIKGLIAKTMLSC